MGLRNMPIMPSLQIGLKVLQNIGFRKQSSHEAHHPAPKQSRRVLYAHFEYKLEEMLAPLGRTEG